MNKREQQASAPADPTQWSEKSKRSVAFEFVHEYKDIPYTCWHCRKKAVFTALDQRYTFEVKKASIDQRRVLCVDCWREANRISAETKDCEERWALAKAQLRTDKAFLTHWLELLVRMESYVPCKPDTARKNMLRNLLNTA